MTGYEQSPEYGGPEPSFWKETRSGLTSIVGIGLFCWAVFGLLSLLSELKFLVEAVHWSVGHVSISFKDILLEIGKRISQAVSGYREFVRSVARLLHLPHLSSFLYDVIGVVTFSGLGYRLGRRAIQARKEWWSAMIERRFPGSGLREVPVELEEDYMYWREHPLQLAYIRLRQNVRWLPLPVGGRKIVARCLVYGGAVAVVLAALFTVDYVYRHFAL
jgi:hypothetical protein